LVRFVVVLATAVIGIALPFFGPMIGLVGAFGSSSLSFILPTVIDLYLHHRRHPWYLLVKNGVILVFGVVALVVGTYSAVLTIVQSL
jgi:solute carrier family 32 (vesicular inhibitory amino acid transporter)